MRNSIFTAILSSLVFACGSGTTPTAATPTTAATPEEAQCGRALKAAAIPGEGQACGGTDHVGCAEGLQCVAKYRCPDSIGKCEKRP